MGIAGDAGRGRARKRAVGTPVLEDLRLELTEFRQQFIEAQGGNTTALKTVRDQLEALGPPPEEGSESEEIASQREELNRRLTRLEAPVRTAELARSRADGLIQGIDQVIRDRQTAELLRLGPMPVNPCTGRKPCARPMGLQSRSAPRWCSNGKARSGDPC